MLCSAFPDPCQETRLVYEHAAAKANHGPGTFGVVATIEKQGTDAASGKGWLLFGELANGEKLGVVSCFLHCVCPLWIAVCRGGEDVIQFKKQC